MTRLQDYFQQALGAYQAQDMDLALQFIQRIYKKDPHFPQILILWGTILARKKAFEAAESKFQEALDENPRDYEAWNNLGVIYKAQEKFAQAIEVLEKARKGLPGRADIPYNLGNIFKSQGRYAQAMEMYTQALELNPHFAMAYNNRGLIFEEQGKREEAEKEYLRGLDSDPRNPSLLYNLGLLEQKSGRWEEAQAAFSKSLKTKPGWHASRNNLGVALQKAGKPQEAKAIFQSLTQENPHSPELWNNYGVTLKELGEEDEAQKAFSKAIEIQPHYTHAVLNLDEVHKKTGQDLDSLTMLQKYLEQDPKNPEIMVRLGEALYHLDKYDGATSYMLQALQIQGDSVKALLILTKAYLAQDRLDLAKKTRAKLLKLEPDHKALSLDFGRFYRKKGLNPNALGEIKQYLSGYPDDREGRVLHAQLELEAGNYEETLNILESFLQGPHPGQSILSMALEAHKKLGNEDEARRILEKLLNDQGPLDQEVSRPKLTELLTTYERSVSSLETAMEDPWAKSISSLKKTQPQSQEGEEESFDPSTLVAREEDPLGTSLLDLGDLNPALVMDEQEETLWVKEEDEVIPSRPEDDEPVLKERIMEQNRENPPQPGPNYPPWPQYPMGQAPGPGAVPPAQAPEHGMTRPSAPPAPGTGPQSPGSTAMPYPPQGYPPQPPIIIQALSPAPPPPSPQSTPPRDTGLPGEKQKEEPGDWEEEFQSPPLEEPTEEEFFPLSDSNEEPSPEGVEEGWGEESFLTFEDQEEPMEDLFSDQQEQKDENSDEDFLSIDDEEEEMDFELENQPPEDLEELSLLGLWDDIEELEPQEEDELESLPMEEKDDQQWIQQPVEGWSFPLQEEEEKILQEDFNFEKYGIQTNPTPEEKPTLEKILGLMNFLGGLTNYLPPEKKASLVEDGIPLKIQEIQRTLDKDGKKAIKDQSLSPSEGQTDNPLGLIHTLDEDDPLKQLGRKVGHRLKTILDQTQEPLNGGKSTK